MLSFTRVGPEDKNLKVSVNAKRVLYVMPHPEQGTVIVFSGACAEEPAIVIQEEYDSVVEALCQFTNG